MSYSCVHVELYRCIPCVNSQSLVHVTIYGLSTSFFYNGIDIINSVINYVHVVKKAITPIVTNLLNKVHNVPDLSYCK